MEPDLRLAGWIATITMGVVAGLKKAAPGMKGWQTVGLAGAVAIVVALLVQFAYAPVSGTKGMCQAGIMTLIAWPVSIGASWLVRLPKRPGNGVPSPG